MITVVVDHRTHLQNRFYILDLIQRLPDRCPLLVLLRNDDQAVLQSTLYVFDVKSSQQRVSGHPAGESIDDEPGRRLRTSDVSL